MKYLILQNTMAPYRISLFNKLYEMGLDIEVLYMCELESYRSWKIDKTIIKYPYEIAKNGYKGKIGGIDIYWCPTFLKRFIKEKNCHIILGGAWVYLDVIATCVMKRLKIIKSPVSFWSEANMLTNGARRKNFIRDILRSFVLNSGEGMVVVPGKMAIMSFEKWGLKNKQFKLLPNVIEEELFLKVSQKEHNFTVFDKIPNFVIPARLSESVKGIINFFKAIGSDNIKKVNFFVLGDGPDRKLIEQFIIDNNYQENIKLCGFCSMEKVAEYYLKSDVLVLPSFSDPSPLSLVEGCCCKLPLLVSLRCGNHFETVEEGKNGYTFDPTNHSDIKLAFENMLKDRYRWEEMGKYGRKLFEKNFAQDNILPFFINSLRY